MLIAYLVVYFDVLGLSCVAIFTDACVWGL